MRRGKNLTLRRLREANGLTMYGAAYMVGVTPSYWWNMEHYGSNPSLKIAFRIAKLFGKSIEEIFGDVVDADFDPEVYIMEMVHKGKIKHIE